MNAKSSALAGIHEPLAIERLRETTRTQPEAHRWWVRRASRAQSFSVFYVHVCHMVAAQWGCRRAGVLNVSKPLRSAHSMRPRGLFPFPGKGWEWSRELASVSMFSYSRSSQRVDLGSWTPKAHPTVGSPLCRLHFLCGSCFPNSTSRLWPC